MLIKPGTQQSHLQSVNFLFFVKCSKHEEQALYKQELQLGRQTAKQNYARSLPTPPAALFQLVARSRNTLQEPWASTPNSSQGTPDLGLLEALTRDEWKASVRAGTEESTEGHLAEE